MAATTYSQPSSPAAGIIVCVRQPIRPRLFDFVTLLCLLLLGYAVLGKLFAYISVGPVYIGEVVLAIGIFVFLIHPRNWLIFRSRHLLPLVALMAWGLIRTVPYVSQYGVNALRDAVIWGYGWFAIIVAALIVENPAVVSRLLAHYGRFCRVFLVLTPIIWLLSMVFGVITLVIDGDQVLILKSGDLMVHLAGVIAFIYLRVRRVSITWLLLAPLVFAVSSSARAGILSLGVSLATLFLLKPRASKMIVVTGLFLATLSSAVALDVRVKVPGVRREMSAQSVVDGIRSVFVQTGTAEYDGTKRWRLLWWGKIVRDTLFGSYFWTGKGFGPNIAFSDGIVSRPGDPLRSPHNGQLTFLARSGVPGFGLWLLVQGGWLLGMLSRWRVSSRAGLERQSNIFLFLIVYWSAFIVNATFDVFLEGPMGGIWFWVTFGVGLGAMVLYDLHSPASLPRNASGNAVTI